MHREEEGGGTCALAFTGADVTDPRYLIIKGSHVEYSLATDRISGDRRARKIVPLPFEAVIDSMDAATGSVVDRLCTSPPAPDPPPLPLSLCFMFFLQSPDPESLTRELHELSMPLQGLRVEGLGFRTQGLGP
jgi:hypothetical protein